MREYALGKALFILIIVLFVGSCAVGCGSYLVKNEYLVTVTDKQVKRQDNEDTYLIFTKLSNGEVRVFENTDSLLYWKWNSSDVFAQLEKGENYRVKTYGWRVPFLSLYENIVSAEKPER